MVDNLSDQAVIRNLKDAGCDTDTVEQFMNLKAKGEVKEQLDLLALQRDRLLERVHCEERKIDCLDYLVYQIHRRETSG